MLQQLFSLAPSASKTISDDQWFEAQFDPAETKRKFGISLPTMADDTMQRAHTALSGTDNMRQAFNFYRFSLDSTGLQKNRNPIILDFGGGWGRIARLYLRETKPKNIFVAETRAEIISYLQSNSPFWLIHNSPAPPMAAMPKAVDLVIAYSVFSHLSEEYFLNWISFFLNSIKPGGHIVFTTRGDYFIQHLKRLHSSAITVAPGLAEHVRRLKEMMPPPDQIEHKYQSGEFQFYPLGGVAELTPDFFGEALIPRAYIEKHLGKALLDFRQDIPTIDQSVVVLRR